MPLASLFLAKMPAHSSPRRTPSHFASIRADFDVLDGHYPAIHMLPRLTSAAVIYLPNARVPADFLCRIARDTTFDTMTAKGTSTREQS